MSTTYNAVKHVNNSPLLASMHHVCPSCLSTCVLRPLSLQSLPTGCSACRCSSSGPAGPCGDGPLHEERGKVRARDGQAGRSPPLCREPRPSPLTPYQDLSPCPPPHSPYPSLLSRSPPCSPVSLLYILDVGPSPTPLSFSAATLLGSSSAGREGHVPRATGHAPLPVAQRATPVTGGRGVGE